MIGGSAGSFDVVCQILAALPADFSLPIIICLHRLKEIREGFVEALSLKSVLPVVEPYDKQKIKGGFIYLAPANYHLYVSLYKQFNLSTEEVVNYSRPSIDLTFHTVGYAYKTKALGIILSGANKDGAMGLKSLKRHGGTAIVQDVEEAKVKTMPEKAKELTPIDQELKTNEIINLLNRI